MSYTAQEVVRMIPKVCNQRQDSLDDQMTFAWSLSDWACSTRTTGSKRFGVTASATSATTVSRSKNRPKNSIEGYLQQTESMMHFKQIGKNRYKVLRHPDDTEFHGTVEKQEYVSIIDGARKNVVKWTAHGIAAGWRESKKQSFATREEAAAFLLKENDVPYHERDMHWSKRQGESADLKKAKAKR